MNVRCTLTSLVLAPTLLTLVGCDMAPRAQTGLPVHAAPHTTVIACIDPTGDDMATIRAALGTLSDALPALAAPGTAGVAVYIRPAAGYTAPLLGAIAVPAVPTSSSARPSIFDVAARKRFEAQSRAAQLALAGVQRRLQGQAARLRGLIVPRTAGPGDGMGCLFWARDTAPATDRRILVDVSALAEAPPVSTTLRLPGDDVRILLTCREGTTTCLQRRAVWLRAFTRWGARAVHTLTLGQGLSLAS